MRMIRIRCFTDSPYHEIVFKWRLNGRVLHRVGKLKTANLIQLAVLAVNSVGLALDATVTECPYDLGNDREFAPEVCLIDQYQSNHAEAGTCQEKEHDTPQD